MKLVRTDPPEQTAITLEEVWNHLRIIPEGSPSETPEDALLERLIQSAIDHIDGVEGYLNRAIVTQSYVGHCGGFPSGREIALPLPPLQSVESIKYLDPSGDEQTLSMSKYRVLTVGEPGRILLKTGQTWPATAAEPDAVRIEFTCGYGDPDDVPAAIKHALLLLVGHMYENREPVAFGAVPVEMPGAVTALLANKRFYGVT